MIFDKSKGTVSLMNSRFIEKHLLGYKRKSEFVQIPPTLIKTVIYTNKAKRNLFVCLRVCPEWPAMPCMEWLPALGIQG